MMLHISVSMQENYVLANSKTCRRQRKAGSYPTHGNSVEQTTQSRCPHIPNHAVCPGHEVSLRYLETKKGGWRRVVDQQSLPVSPQHETLEGGSTPGMRRTNQGRLRQYSASGYFMTCSSIRQHAMFLAMAFGYALAMEVQGTPDGRVPRN